MYNRAVTAAENLERLGIVVPEPPAAVGAYVTWLRAGNLVLTSGQLPWRNKTMLHPGRLGGEVSVEDGYQAARQAELNAIAQLKSASGGDLERIRRIVRLEGYVHCVPGFRDHPKILDGASDLLLEVFEERGKHVRIACWFYAVQPEYRLGPGHMNDPVRRRSLRMLLLFAAAYVVIGIAFGTFSDAATTNAMRLLWRRLAWLVSGIGFAAHIAYGHYRPRNVPRTTAMQVSIAAALGAGGLALAANLHEWMAASRYRPSVAFALVAWPLLTVVPAFVVAMVGAALLNRWYPRSETQ